jgi:hypothetical protein
MAEPKKQAIISLLDVLSTFTGGFRIEDGELVILDMDNTMSVLRLHSIDLLALSALDIEEKARDVFIKGRLEETIYQVMLLKEIEKVLGILEEENISAIMLKGFSLRRYYPLDCIRPISDIDFLVRPDDKYRCLEAFRKAGYGLVKEHELDRLLQLHGELTWVNPQTRISVELHWDMVNAKSMRKVINFDPDFIFGRMEKYKVEKMELNVLSAPVELAYLMTHHVLHHQFKRLLWLADVLLMLTGEDVDWVEFEKTVVHLKIERPVYYYLEALEGIFGKGCPDLGEIGKRLRPRSTRYFFFSRFNPPARIFRKGQFSSKLKDTLFRSAFK